MQVIQFVNSVYQSNTFLLTKENYSYVWLIDCGDTAPILKWLKQNNKTLIGILLTHSHYDHIYGLLDIVGVFPDLRILTSYEGKEGLQNDKWNFSRYHNEKFIFKGNNIEILTENSEIILFPNVKLKTISTPGHDWSCLSYKYKNYFFTGDSYIPKKKLITTFPKSNKDQATKSLQKILSQINEDTIICPGHGSMMKDNKFL